jgi:hypothetical protein
LKKCQTLIDDAVPFVIIRRDEQGGTYYDHDVLMTLEINNDSLNFLELDSNSLRITLKEESDDPFEGAYFGIDLIKTSCYTPDLPWSVIYDLSVEPEEGSFVPVDLTFNEADQ